MLTSTAAAMLISSRRNALISIQYVIVVMAANMVSVVGQRVTIVSPSAQVTAGTDACSSSPCRHNATCVGGANKFSCRCLAGYTGELCQTDINECASNPCHNGGQCIDGINMYSCECKAGFSGILCTRDISECASSPCQNEAACQDGVNKFVCQCVSGFTGVVCETNIDDCASLPCHNEATCIDLVNAFNCSCPVGFTGLQCETDIDHCTSLPCHNNATCIDDVSAFSCSCPAGYTGLLCETEIDECANNTCPNGSSCVDGIAMYTCQCVDGFTGVMCETDIDECASSPCVNNGTCSNQIGIFACSCPDGFTGIACEEENDDCTSSSCQNNGLCIDAVVSYSCACAEGYTGVSCETEIDECASTPCQNNGSCSNGINQFTCECADGFTGVQCEAGLDECASQPCQNGGLCVDGINGFSCQCNSEFTGVTCETNVDQCLSSPCLNGATCVDGISKFTCACAVGYTGVTCMTDIDECLSLPCRNGGTCSDSIAGYSCTCAAGWNGINCEFSGPIFYSLYPDKGPLEGGTTVTFSLSSPVTMFPVSVSIGQLIVPVNGSSLVVPRRDTILTVVARTPPLINVSSVGIQQQVRMRFNNSQSYRIPQHFTYYALPVITHISPNAYIYTGGTRLTIYGNGLDISVAPQLEVTTIRTQASLVNRAVYRSTSCTNVTDTTLTCILPTPLLSTTITKYLDSIVNTTEPLVRRGYLDDGSGSTVYIYVGLIFDGNVKYRNLTDRLGRNGSMVIIPGPLIPTMLQRSDMWTFEPGTGVSQSPQKLINGLYLTRALSLADFSVYVEGRSCQVDSFNDTLLWVTIPSTNGLAFNNSQYPFKCDRLSYRVQVYVGYRQVNYRCAKPYLICASSPCQNNGSCIEDSVSYTCNCSYPFYGQICEFAYPVISDVSPTKGTIFGGARITITGAVPLERFSAVGVSFGNSYSAQVIFQNSTNILVDTPAVDNPKSLSITVFFAPVLNDTGSDFYPVTASQPFTFGLEPIIQNIYPLEHTASGGTTLTVTGLGMDAVVSPFIKIHTMLNTSGINNVRTSLSLSFSSTCRVQTNSTMYCKMPQLDLPDAFLYFLDNQSYTPSPSLNPIIISEPDGVGSRSQCPIRKPPTGQPNPIGVRLSIVFQFDGEFDDTPVAYNGSKITVYPPPNICFNSSLLTFDDKDLVIQGLHLLRGVSWSDYTVHIENFMCNIRAVTNNVLQFNPTSNTTQKMDFTQWLCPKDFPYRLVITVAGMKQYFAGCVRFNDNVPLTDYCNTINCLNNGACVDGHTTKPRCRCTEKYYGNTSCEFPGPNLDRLQPTYGPFGGGTVITVFGTIPSRMKPVTVSFHSSIEAPRIDNTSTVGNWTDYTWTSDDIVFSNQTCIIVMSPSAAGAPIGHRGITAIMTVWFNESGIPWPVAGNFTFIANPNITSLSPRDHITSGGTVISITGSNMDAALEPWMTIVISTLNPKFDQVTQLVEGLSYFPTPNCSVISQQLVTCRMPSTEVLQEFYPLLGTKVADPSAIADERRRRRATLNDDVITAGERDWSPVRWRRGLSGHRRRRDMSLILESGKKMTVYVIIEFDGLVVNLSDVIKNSTLLLHKPPSVDIPTTIIPFYPSHSQIIELQGDGFTLGSNWTTDGAVFIGGVNCVIDDVARNRIHIHPPDLIVDDMTSLREANQNVSVCTTTSDKITPAMLSAIFPLEVRVGYGVFPAGCVQYVSTASEDLRRCLDVRLVVWNVVAVFVVRLALRH